MLCCPFCGWPDAEPVTTVSVHPTAAGVTLWTRCVCGSLQSRTVDGAVVRVTARSRPRAAVAA
jgi:hypothetical protein